jgi:hypothetical protein
MAGMALMVLSQMGGLLLHKLAELIGVRDIFVSDSMQSTNTFITIHKKEIPYFNYSNPVKHFYDQATQKRRYFD